MASKMRRRGSGAGNTQVSGGFVPASQQQGSRRGGPKANPMDFNAVPAGAGVGGFGDSVSQYSRNSVDYSDRRQGMAPGKKRALIAVIAVLVIALAVGGFFAFKEYQKALINQDLHSMSQSEMEAVDNELTGSIHFDEPFTMLLLGSDARSDDPGMGARTDTIILTRIDPTTNNISMLSIPRDTMIEIPSVGTQKFNAAYTYGGPSGTIAAVKTLCGVDIDHYAEVNFEGLVGLIDAIGGIDVVVEETVDDPDAGDVVIPAGEQHLDGAAALTFSRSRAYADGDYTRVSNQRKVIEAIVHRGLNAPATELHGLIQASTEFLTTDSAMDVDFIYSLADQIRHNNDYPVTITSATLPSSTATIGGVSYVIADQAGVAEIIRIFNEGGDISQPLENSSIDSDRATASGNAGAGYIDDSHNYHADEPVYYAPEPTYVNPDPSPSTTGGNATEVTDPSDDVPTTTPSKPSGGNADGGSGADGSTAGGSTTGGSTAGGSNATGGGSSGGGSSSNKKAA